MRMLITLSLQGGIHEVVDQRLQGSQVPFTGHSVRLLHRPRVQEVRAVDQTARQVRVRPRPASVGHVGQHQRNCPHKVTNCMEMTS